jgi:hypothetical protein
VRGEYCSQQHTTRAVDCILLHLHLHVLYEHSMQCLRGTMEGPSGAAVEHLCAVARDSALQLPCNAASCCMCGAQLCHNMPWMLVSVMCAGGSKKKAAAGATRKKARKGPEREIWVSHAADNAHTPLCAHTPYCACVCGSRVYHYHSGCVVWCCVVLRLKKTQHSESRLMSGTGTSMTWLLRYAAID